MLGMVPHGFVNRLPFGLYGCFGEGILLQHFVSQLSL